MEKLTEHTFRRSAGASAPPATLDQLSWLVGHWAGPAFGGTCEEVWSAPAGGAMMGMFRLVQGDTAIFYEFLTLTQQQDTISFQLKHFHPDLKGWEEKDGMVTFPLAALEPDAAHFEGISFHRQGDNQITIYLALHQTDGTVQETEFRYTRMVA